MEEEVKNGDGYIQKVSTVVSQAYRYFIYQQMKSTDV
jgi:hypothetical protein